MTTSRNPELVFALAVRLVQAGRLGEAHQALAAAAVGRGRASAEVLRLLAKLDLQAGRAAEALRTMKRALKADPGLPEARYELGVMLLANERLAEAATAFRKALADNPGDQRARFNLAWALGKAGRPEAADAYRDVLAHDPDNVDAWFNLGNLLAPDDPRQARAAYDEALQRAPEREDVRHNLSHVLVTLGRHADAWAVVTGGPDASRRSPMRLKAMGKIAMTLGRNDEAEQAFRDSLRAAPEDWETRYNLAMLCYRDGRLAEAEALMAGCPARAEHLNLLAVIALSRFQPLAAERHLRQALAQAPDWADLHNNLGKVQAVQGEIAEAQALFRRAHELAPEDAAIHSNYLFSLCHDPAVDEDTLCREHLRYGDIQEGRVEPLAIEPPGARQRRRLRLGFLSPDFREHAVMMLLLPVLRRLDRARFEIHCYFTSSRGDAVTEAVAASADAFHRVAWLPPAAVARRIAEDGIDVLIDLAGHTANNALPVMAHRPAPMQATWLGYPFSTGMRRVDYRLGLGAPPPGVPDPHGTERLVALSALPLFVPPAASPDPLPPPVLRSGRVTFGSLNRASKINPAVARAWGLILARMPTSRLIMLADDGDQPAVRDGLLDLLGRHGADTTRIEVAKTVSYERFLHFINGIDVALDPFPYGGGTTTLTTLWMGVPVVTLKGAGLRQGTSASMLAGVRLNHLIAESEDDYVEAACRTAADTAGLARLRAEGRARMLLSPMLDEVAYVRRFEEVVLALWPGPAPAAPMQSEAQA